MERSSQMFYTNNLDMFRFHPVNRKFTGANSKARIRKIAESMKVDGLKMVAIIVTSKFYIVDGQHRVEAAKIAGKGIWYTIDATIPNTPQGIFKAARILNRYTHNWEKGDFINGQTEMGSKDYQLLESFRQRFPEFSLTDQLSLLANSGGRSITKNDFADGKFSVANLHTAEEWATNLLKLKDLFPEGYNKANFVRTMLSIMEKQPKFKFEEFYHKLKLRPSSLKICGTKDSYSELIESIYNFKRRPEDRVPLRLKYL